MKIPDTNESKYVQIISDKKTLYPENIRNSQNSLIRKQQPNFKKNGQKI